MQIRCKKIVAGIASGRAIVTSQPINFLTMVDVNKGIIRDQSHDLYSKSLKDAVLVFPNAIGSSVGAYAIYDLKRQDLAPCAIVCTGKADITTASGCAIANIPMVSAVDHGFLFYLKSLELEVDANEGKILIKKI